MPGAAVLVGTLVTVVACSGSVRVAEPSPDHTTTKRCKTLVSAMPTKNNDHEQRDVKPDSPLTAAWGDPPIRLACGVSKPTGMKADSKCWEVNGVGWYSETRSDDYRFTTLGRKAYVQVRVPKKQSPQADALVDLAPAIKKHDPMTQKCV